MNSHKQRLTTALLMAMPLLLLLGFGPPWSWFLMVMAASFAGLWEFERLLLHEGLPSLWRPFYFLVGLLLPLGAFAGGTVGLHSMLVGGIFAGFLFLLFISPLDPSGIVRLAQLNLGWLYIPYLLSYVLLIAKMEGARGWLFFIFAVIVAGDAGAFYTGKSLGRHKLYERVSPKKTLEGSLGGLLASLVCGTFCGYIVSNGVSIGRLLLLSGTLGLVGQVGDLVESMIKRVSGKKDSSQLLPGHGGLLDRMDSLLFVFPAMWFFLTWLV